MGRGARGEEGGRGGGVGWKVMGPGLKGIGNWGGGGREGDRVGGRERRNCDTPSVPFKHLVHIFGDGA